MGHIVILEAAEHVEDGVSLAYIGKELVTQALTLARALHKAGNIDDFYRGRHNAFGIAHLHKLVEPGIRHSDDTDVRLDGAEWEIGRLGLCVGETVEKSGFAHVREPHNTTLECHGYILLFLF